MRVVVFEPRVTGGGHYFQYAGNLLSALIHVGISPTLLCGSRALEDVAFNSHIGNHLNRPGKLHSCKIAPVVPHSAYLCNSSHAIDDAIDALKAYLATHPTDWLYMTTGDGLLQRLAIRGARWMPEFSRLKGFESLLLNGRAGYPGKGRMRARISQRLAILAGCTRIHFVDPYAGAPLAKKSKRFNIICEPVEDLRTQSQQACRQRLDIPPLEGSLLGVVGRQDERKGLQFLVDGLLAAGETLQHVSLLLAGQGSEFLETQLQRLQVGTLQPVSIIRRDGFLDDETLRDAIGACDALALPYTTPFQSSGILTRAGIIGVPVVTSKLGFLGKLCQQFELGISIDIHDASAMAMALKTVLSGDGDSNGRVAESASQDEQTSPGSLDLRQFHTLENTQMHWTWHLRQHIEQAETLAPLSWQDITMNNKK